MLEKFSAGAIQAINAAREEALRLEFNQVEPEHLLLGLAHERMGAASRAMRRFGVELKHLRLAVDSLTGRGYSLIRMEDLVFSPAALRVLARAAQANPTLVEGQDVLLALLEERESLAVAALAKLNIDCDQLRAYTDEYSDQSQDDAQPAEAAIVPTHFSRRLLTEKAAAALDAAYAATRHFGHTIVGTEQLLTGLIAVEGCLASQVLAANGVRSDEVEAVASRVIGRGSGTVSGRLTLSRWCDEVLEAAWGLAKRLKHGRVGTGHILLAMIELDVGGALYLLDHLDINLAQLRYDVEQAFAAAPGDAEPETAYPFEPSAEAVLGADGA